MTRRLLLAVAVVATSCAPNPPITIQPNDQSGPIVTLDVYDGNPPHLSASNSMPAPAPMTVGSAPRMGFAAKGTDAESGIRDIQIWTEITTWRTDPATGVVTPQGPGLAGAPTASNPDAAKQPGEPADSTRSVGHTVDVRQLKIGKSRIRVVVWARAINHQGTSSETPRVTITSP